MCPEDSDLAHTRIVKRLAPGQAGSKKLVQRFGTALVCVRYRQDPARGRRYTTVELLVDEGPMLGKPSSKNNKAPLVHVHIHLRESDLRKSACAKGAQWDPATQTWCMTRNAAIRLGLRDRILNLHLPMATENGNS